MDDRFPPLRSQEEIDAMLRRSVWPRLDTRSTWRYVWSFLFG